MWGVSSLETATRDGILHPPWEVCCTFCHLYRVSFQQACKPGALFLLPWVNRPSLIPANRRPFLGLRSLGFNDLVTAVLYYSEDN